MSDRWVLVGENGIVYLPLAFYMSEETIRIHCGFLQRSDGLFHSAARRSSESFARCCGKESVTEHRDRDFKVPYLVPLL